MTISVFVFLLAVVLVAGAAWLLVRAGQRERQEAMLLRARASGGFIEEVEATAGIGSRQIGNPLLRWACHLVWRSGVELEPPAIARVLLVLLLLAPVALLAFGTFAGLTILAVLILFGWLILSRRAAARRARIIEQLPDFLESAIRVLSAGNTLEESFAAAARESPEPIRPLFVSVGRQVRLGAPIEAVLQEAAEIHKIQDLKVLALASLVNRKYGGSLRNILRSLIQAIRTRDMAARELRALTAETRFSALVLCVIPIALVLFIISRNPDYYVTMWQETSGRAFLIGSVVMQVLGIGVIFRMMRSVEER